MMDANLDDSVPKLQLLPGVIGDVPQGDRLPPSDGGLVVSPLYPLLNDVGEDNLAIATSPSHLTSSTFKMMKQ